MATGILTFKFLSVISKFCLIQYNRQIFIRDSLIKIVHALFRIIRKLGHFYFLRFRFVILFKAIVDLLPKFRMCDVMR
jgi:hypothetical protein